MNFLQSLHQSTRRDYLARMTAEKPECMRIAKQYGHDYWDGDRKYGYGGYKYDGRWKPIAEAMVKHYELKSASELLDIGCGKGFLADEFNKLQMCVHGLDISGYATANTRYKRGDCRNIVYEQFSDFTYSINVFHNLSYKDLKQSIHEMVRVTKPDGKSFICVESYRNEEELCNLQCWALTCQSFYSPDDWKEILTDNGYRGDIEFIFFN